jgi:hypothetical protein
MKAKIRVERKLAFSAENFVTPAATHAGLDQFQLEALVTKIREQAAPPEDWLNIIKEHFGGAHTKPILEKYRAAVEKVFETVRVANILRDNNRSKDKVKTT